MTEDKRLNDATPQEWDKAYEQSKRKTETGVHDREPVRPDAGSAEAHPSGLSGEDGCGSSGQDI